MSKHQTIIGRAEKIDFIAGVFDVPAKIDSGAFRSSVHASNIKVTKERGEAILSFRILGHPCSPKTLDIKTSKFNQLKIRSSNGKVDIRYEITLKIKLGNKIFNTSFTLADRSKNVYPVLVGRKALKNRFMIEVAHTSVKRMELKKHFGILAPEDEEDLED